MSGPCARSCKGLCQALEAVERRESDLVAEYGKFVEMCDYPDVREILGELMQERRRALERLRAKKEILKAKFETLDGINESFA